MKIFFTGNSVDVSKELLDDLLYILGRIHGECPDKRGKALGRSLEEHLKKNSRYYS